MATPVPFMFEPDSADFLRFLTALDSFPEKSKLTEAVKLMDFAWSV
jgi:hypothetical protein